MRSANAGGLNQAAQIVEDEIAELEARLAQAKGWRKALGVRTSSSSNLYGKPPQDDALGGHQQPAVHLSDSHSLASSTHFLLLLADSALPLGSFAFSSGLESFLAHNRLNPFTPSSFTESRQPSSSAAVSSLPPPPILPSSCSPSPSPSPLPFDLFLPISIASYASTTLPFLLTAHRDPTRLIELDDALDAAIICTVGKRASVAQGRALLGLWERSFASSHHTTNGNTASSAASSSSSSSSPQTEIAIHALKEYTTLLRSPSSKQRTINLPPPIAVHLAPLFGIISILFHLSLHQTAYIYMLGHVKALVSAAVRANLMGPYAAQKVLAAPSTQEMITAAIEREWNTEPEEAGQGVPVMDLWVGRHEVLYSRIFNS